MAGGAGDGLSPQEVFYVRINKLLGYKTPRKMLSDDYFSEFVPLRNKLHSPEGIHMYEYNSISKGTLLDSKLITSQAGSDSAFPLKAKIYMYFLMEDCL